MASPIQQFYKNQNVFITGVTGVLGKILVEHLLRKTDVNIVYVLIRGKRGETAEKRFHDLLKNEIFANLRQNQPSVLHKIKCIPGNLCDPNLGLDENDSNTLIDNVDIVFHAGAEVKFNVNLKKTIEINVGGTESMLELSSKMKRLKIFMYVSTLFTEYHLDELKEQIQTKSSIDLIKLAQSVDYETAAKMEKIILGKSANAYVLTKHASEALCQKYQFPVGIFRPGIVLACYKEPLPGWIESYQGPTAILMGTAIGALHSLYSFPDASCDIVPADMTINCLMAITWDAASKVKPMIYNYAPPVGHRINYRTLVDKTITSALNDAQISPFRYPFYFFTRNKVSYATSSFFFHFLPAAVGDLFLAISGKKRRLLDLHYKLWQVSLAVIPFSTKSWKVHTDNVQDAWNRLDSRDRTTFPFNFDKHFSWDDYLRVYSLGIRRYLLKGKLKEKCLKPESFKYEIPPFS